MTSTINPLIVLEILRNKLRRKFSNLKEPGLEDKSFAQYLAELIIQKHANTLEESVSYELFRSDEEIDIVMSAEDSVESSQIEGDSPTRVDLNESFGSGSSSYQCSPVKKPCPSVLANYTEEFMETVYNYRYSHRKDKPVSYEKLIKRWPKLENGYNIRLLLEYVEEKKKMQSQEASTSVLKIHGNKYDKLKKVKEAILLKFDLERDRGSSIHDWQIKLWAVRAAKENGLENFKASAGFLKRFKSDHHLSSRKVTRFVTVKDVDDEALNIACAQKFVSEVNQVLVAENFRDDEVWNSDQSQFNYEMTGQRTLSHTGEKHTICTVQSINSTTHSYTIDVVLSKSGTLGKLLYICFQEKDGKFGKNVSREVAANRPPNIFADASSSGKMSKTHLETFFKHVFDENVAQRALMLCDSWSGHKDPTTMARALPGKDIKIMIIPPKTTKYVQPLDVYFFRQYKTYVRRIEDFVRQSDDDAQENLHNRLFIMKMHSVVYNQISAPSYSEMLRYAWKKSGYSMQEDVPEFKNVIQKAFDIGSIECFHEDCDNMAFINCSYCTCGYCYDHFIREPHYHFD